MSEETVYTQEFVDALIESNEILQDEVTKLRNRNRICRTVISAIRRTVASLQEQIATARENDETFKAFCAGEFDPATPAVESVPDATGTV